ncbi:MAG: DUF6441 family protein [Pseudomonadota bacterium]
MRVDVQIEGSPRQILGRRLQGTQRGVTRAVREVGTQLKADWRAAIVAAGLGRRLANSVRNRTFPGRGTSLGAAALVFSKAPEILGSQARGARIRSKDGFFLAVPTDAAPKGPRGSRLSPGEVERRLGIRLRFVFRRGRPSLLVADNFRVSRTGRVRQNTRIARGKKGTGGQVSSLKGRATVVMFVLLPEVRLKPKVDLRRPTERARQRLPRLIGFYASRERMQ